ncbi:hypothetical protein HQ34_05765 [Porphyromonas cangingivalis]|nr:hypothetical protein HQ34_05765 [Porphyromonas cangingivalis]
MFIHCKLKIVELLGEVHQDLSFSFILNLQIQGGGFPLYPPRWFRGLTLYSILEGFALPM